MQSSGIPNDLFARREVKVIRITKQYFCTKLLKIAKADAFHRSRRGDRLKILYWDAQGYTLWYRRLEQGTFRFPKPREGEASLSISATDLAMLLDGVELSSVKRQPRYRRPA